MVADFALCCSTIKNLVLYTWCIYGGCCEVVVLRMLGDGVVSMILLVKKTDNLSGRDIPKGTNLQLDR